MSTAFSVFSPQQWKVLQALSVYRFLTVDQMLRLGISKNAKSLRDKTLFALRHHRCIHSEKIGSFLPDLHHLTKHGQDMLFQVEGEGTNSVPSTKRIPFSPVFAPHRFAQVDFHMGFRQWAEMRGDAEVVLELQDFVRSSAGRNTVPKSATEIVITQFSKPIIPDGIFAVSLTTGKVALYLVEVHRSTQSQAITEQLARYFEVIKSGTIAQQFGYAVNPIICSVHHQPSVLLGVKTRLQQHPEYATFKHNFVFHALEDLNTNFSGGWHFGDDKPAHPFPTTKPKPDAR